MSFRGLKWREKKIKIEGLLWSTKNWKLEFPREKKFCLDIYRDSKNAIRLILNDFFIGHGQAGQ